MKKIALLLITLVIAGVVYAGETVLLIDRATATGAGSSKSVASQNASQWGCDAVVTGNPTAVVVRIEGNQGLTTRFSTVGMAEHTFTAAERTAKIASFSIDASPVKVMRANVITFTNGSTITVSCSGR